MRFFKILVSSLVLTCVMILSYSQMLDLFKLGGLDGWLGHLGAFAVEGAFLLMCLTVATAKLQGKQPRAFDIIGILLMIAFIGLIHVANIWVYGVTGVLLGFVPAITFILAFGGVDVQKKESKE